MKVSEARPIFGTRVASLIQIFLEHKPNISEDSAKKYKIQIQHFFDYCARHRIRKPRQQHVQEYIRSMIYLQNSADYINNLITAQKNFFSVMEEEGFYPNIYRRIERVTNRKGHRRKELTPDQFARIIKAMPRGNWIEERNRMILLLMGYTGIRRHAVAELSMNDVCFHPSLPAPVLVKIRLKGHIEKLHEIRLHDAVSHEMREYIHLMKSDYSLLAEERVPVFPKQCGGFIKPSTISRIFKDAARKVGINDSKITCHSMRHMFATVAKAKNAAAEDIQDALGHAKVSTTMDTYSHRGNEGKNNALKTVGDELISVLSNSREGQM